MKLLILTQKVDTNDDVLGFMHGWIKEFAEKLEQVIVVCLQKGQHELPPNVKVYSLGKEDSRQLLKRIKYLLKFYGYIWRERKNYDAVLAHMNPEYVVLGGLLWRILGKKTALWYTHKKVDLKLRLAEKFSNIIFTASAKSFRLESKKINIMGHGIDVELFTPAIEPMKEKTMLSVDRISPTKNQLEIVKLFAAIKEKVGDCRLYLVGVPALAADKYYFNKVKEYVRDNNLNGQVKFLGAVANKNMPKLYQQAKVFVNFSATGSLDKTVLEAMACNTPVVTTNEAFKNIVPAENYSPDMEDARQKVIYFLENDVHINYREIVIRDHSLKNLVDNIIKKLAEK